MKKMSKRKKWLFIGGGVVVIVLVVLAVTKNKGNQGTKVTTEVVEKRTITETVSANGKIQPAIDVKISPYISGEVVELYVKEGDEVEAGDLLAKIDPEIYISNYERMEANLNSQKAILASSRARMAQSEAQFINAELSFERNKKLWEQQVISNADFEAVKSSYQVSKAEVDAASQSVKSSEYAVKSSEASLKEARENLTRTTIKTPTNGKISRLSILKGERVTGASQFSSGTEIMRIANLNNMEAFVEVNENDIVRVSLGDTCDIEVDAYLDKIFKGLVTEIATSANVAGVSADQVTNFDVKIQILSESYADLIPEDNPSYSPLRPGMSATVEIQTETNRNLITVPIQAVTTRSTDTTKTKAGERSEEIEGSVGTDDDKKDDMKEVVFIYEDGIARMQVVETGIQDNTFIIITSGVEDGQEIISGPYRAVSKQLKDGDNVKKVDKKDLYTAEN
ncbi:MAG: efflux RND transporter periplasmic adaptor subunit [Bacteroidota bacterium]|nr:efflux RND transporter periplasmic adaptor subunit [Bacteroidota bacterium]